MVTAFKNVGKRSAAKNYRPVRLFFVVSKVFEKPVNNRTIDHLEKCGLFLISSMVLGLLGPLQILLQLYLIELLGLLTGMGLLKLQHLIYPMHLTGFGNFLFLVLDSFKGFRMGSPHKNIQLMLEFLKAPFLVLMMLSVILLSDDTTLICGNNYN